MKFNEQHNNRFIEFYEKGVKVEKNCPADIRNCFGIGIASSINNVLTDQTKLSRLTVQQVAV